MNTYLKKILLNLKLLCKIQIPIQYTRTHKKLLKYVKLCKTKIKLFYSETLEK